MAYASQIDKDGGVQVTGILNIQLKGNSRNYSARRRSAANSAFVITLVRLSLRMAKCYANFTDSTPPADHILKPFKCTGIRWLHLKLFSAIQV